MAKFHINGKGEAGTCRAKKDGCPFGAEAEHYPTADEAREAFEQKMGGSFAENEDDPFDAGYWDSPEGKLMRLKDGLGHGEDGEQRLEALKTLVRNGDEVAAQDRMMQHFKNRGRSQAAYSTLWPVLKAEAEADRLDDQSDGPFSPEITGGANASGGARMNEYYRERQVLLEEAATLHGLRKMTPEEEEASYARFGRKAEDSPYQREFFKQEAYAYDGNLTEDLTSSPVMRENLGYWQVSVEEVEAWSDHAYGGFGHLLASNTAEDLSSSFREMKGLTAESTKADALGYLIKRASFGVYDTAEGTSMDRIPGGTRFDGDGNKLS